MKSDLFFGENDDLYKSSVYLGMHIISKLEKNDRATIYEVFDSLRKKYSDVNYSNVMNALTFLYMTDLIRFQQPYFELSNNDNA